MQGNNRVIDHLNKLLAGELAADIQYGHHEAVAINDGLQAHAEYIGKRKAAEREHIVELRDHILLLGGVPVTAPDPINAVEDIEGGLSADDASEAKAITDYTNGITLAVGLKDEATANLLRHILAEEVEHKNGTETVLKRIETAGYANWAASQFGG